MAPIGPGEIEARFDARQVLTMAMRLPVSQIEALAESTDLREAGLRAARNGAVADGRRLVASARENRCCVILETEADLLFETYQQAAEAFLAYRDGQFDRAYLQMRLAISHANRLRQDYAYPTELRRVHLGANLLRVSVAAGDWPRAVTQGLGLLGYLLGRRQDWPWPDLTLQDADLISVECSPRPEAPRFACFTWQATWH